VHASVLVKEPIRVVINKWVTFWSSGITNAGCKKWIEPSYNHRKMSATHCNVCSSSKWPIKLYLC
jgi:hypothetical protein